MSDSGVYDRWHKSRPVAGEPCCREHGMVPSSAHLAGDRWQARWRDAGGAQRKANFGRKADAARHLATAVADTARGTYISPADGNVTFRAFAEDWRTARTHDMVTAGRLERSLRLHVYPAIGHRAMRELAARPSLIQAWISGMRLSPGSARLVIGDVSAVFTAALDDGIVTRNPVRARSVTRPKVPEAKARPWTLAQVEAMAGALPARYAVVPYLGTGAGLRQGEMFGLAVDDIDFLRRVIHVRRQVRLIGSALCFAPVKNDKAHDVPLAESLAPELAEHIRKFPPASVTLPWRVPGGGPVTAALLLTRAGGLAMHRSRFNDTIWRPSRTAAGIAGGRENGCHVLRHTAASAWLSAGVGIPAVAAWLGDTEATVLATYAHLMPDDTDRGRRAMDQFFAARAPDVPARAASDET